MTFFSFFRALQIGIRVSDDWCLHGCKANKKRKNNSRCLNDSIRKEGRGVVCVMSLAWAWPAAQSGWGAAGRGPESNPEAGPDLGPEVPAAGLHLTPGNDNCLSPLADFFVAKRDSIRTAVF